MKSDKSLKYSPEFLTATGSCMENLETKTKTAQTSMMRNKVATLRSLRCLRMALAFSVWRLLKLKESIAWRVNPETNNNSCYVIHSKGNRNLSTAIEYVSDVAENSEEASAVGSMDTKETGELNVMWTVKCELCLNREKTDCFCLVLWSCAIPSL